MRVYVCTCVHVWVAVGAVGVSVPVPRKPAWAHACPPASRACLPGAALPGCLGGGGWAVGAGVQGGGGWGAWILVVVGGGGCEGFPLLLFCFWKI